MAGDWIKVEHATIDKPEINRMSIALGIDHDAVVGKCLRLWVWVDQQSSDGHALSVTNAFVDRITFCDGFAKALLSVGWLDGRDGLLSIPNFDRHNGKTAKTRALSNDRKRKSRDCHDTSVTKAFPEKRREEKKLKLSLLEDSEFCEVWERWKRHRSQKFKPLGAIEEETQLMELGRQPSEAVAIVNFSISRGALNLISNGDHRPRQPKSSGAKQKMEIVRD